MFIKPNFLSGLSFKTFSFELHDGVPVQLFKLVDGFAESSEAFRVAKKEGIGSETISRYKLFITQTYSFTQVYFHLRAIEVLESIQSGTSIKPPERMYDMKLYTDICSKFLNLDFKSEDWKVKMEEIFEQALLL